MIRRLLRNGRDKVQLVAQKLGFIVFKLRMLSILVLLLLSASGYTHEICSYSSQRTTTHFYDRGLNIDNKYMERFNVRI